ncbi:transposase [Bradyrhizobium sp. CCGUVB1N3]|uniref:transposase n=1 Tax=Bradyrhizobium sp. CCGUVB1N3 TaxID=2949629 RepID=UPI0020B45873|nr:transposase [Bradyrhizobium sp. CCGUVB1N3]MCP3476143.1 transposase [Bradyrhizobium sp. CCGUVB1N3]
MLSDGLGRPLRFKLTAGQRHDNLTAKALLEGFKAEAVLADRAYDNNDLQDHRRYERRSGDPLNLLSQGPHSA